MGSSAKSAGQNHLSHQARCQEARASRRRHVQTRPIQEVAISRYYRDISPLLVAKDGAGAERCARPQRVGGVLLLLAVAGGLGGDGVLAVTVNGSCRTTRICSFMARVRQLLSTAPELIVRPCWAPRDSAMVAGVNSWPGWALMNFQRPGAQHAAAQRLVAVGVDRAAAAAAALGGRGRLGRAGADHLMAGRAAGRGRVRVHLTGLAGAGLPPLRGARLGVGRDAAGRVALLHRLQQPGHDTDVEPARFGDLVNRGAVRVVTEHPGHRQDLAVGGRLGPGGNLLVLGVLVARVVGRLAGAAVAVLVVLAVRRVTGPGFHSTWTKMLHSGSLKERTKPRREISRREAAVRREVPMNRRRCESFLPGCRSSLVKLSAALPGRRRVGW